jgi:hypothetical protein
MLQCNTSSASHNGADTNGSDAVTKIDLNEATREQLLEDAGLRPLVADAVLKARDERGGGIADIGALKDALGEVKGIGPATLDQLGDVLKVGRKAAKPADEKPAEAAPPAAQAGGEEAGRATDEAAEATAPVAKVARRTAEETAAPVVEAGVEAAADAATTGTKVARRTAEETVAPPAVERTVEVVSEVARRRAEAAERATERAAEVALTVVRGGVEAAGRTAGSLAGAGKAATARSGDAVGELGRLVAELVNEQVRANVEALRALGRARTWPEVLEAHATFFRGNLERMTEGSGRYLEAVTRLAAGPAGGGRGRDKTAA